METLKSFVDHFFERHKAHLTSTYPGLSTHRLYLELEAFLTEQNGHEVASEQIYIPTFEGPVSNFLEGLLQGVPLQYLSGKAAFYGTEFLVDKRVLVPRSETELLVEMALSEVKKLELPTDGTFSLIDVGTGSGAIVLSLLRNLVFPCEALAIDLSEEALEVASKNWFRHRYAIHPQTKLRFCKGDRLKEVKTKAHVIVSNPPYIKQRNHNRVHPQVLKHEPHGALFLADESYLGWYEEFFGQSFQVLHEGGVFLIEGEEDMLPELQVLCKKQGFQAPTLHKDLTGRARFLKASK